MLLFGAEPFVFQAAIQKFKDQDIYRTLILPVVLYGCDTWSQTLREERKLRVFENMVLRRILGPRKDEVTGEWRRLHNEELNDLYSSPNIVRVIKSRRMRWEGHVARMEESSGAYLVLVGKPEGKRILGRPWCRRKDNIKKDILEVEWGSWTDRSGSGQGRVAGSCQRGNEPSFSIKYREFLDYLRTG